MDDVIRRLDTDVKRAAAAMDHNHARMLVDTYYQIQKDRVRAQLRHGASEEIKASEVLGWVRDQSRIIEDQIKVMLDLYSGAQPIGRWMRAQHGIGPVIAAGLIANLDITKAPTAGHFWSFAGLPCAAKPWGKGEKRPWNASLKRLCFLIGESFVKVSGKPDALYGQLYVVRKRLEWERNANGDFSTKATEYLQKKNIQDKATRAWYNGEYTDVCLSETVPPKGLKDPDKTGIPMLCPGHIHMRAKNYAVTIFLAHLQQVWYELHYGTPAPRPFVEAHLGHVHIIPPRVKWSSKDVENYIKTLATTQEDRTMKTE